MQEKHKAFLEDAKLNKLLGSTARGKQVLKIITSRMDKCLEDDCHRKQVDDMQAILDRSPAAAVDDFGTWAQAFSLYSRVVAVTSAGFQAEHFF